MAWSTIAVVLGTAAVAGSAVPALLRQLRRKRLHYVRVRGYYRQGGTYVRAHTRKDGVRVIKIADVDVSDGAFREALLAEGARIDDTEKTATPQASGLDTSTGIDQEEVPEP